MNHPIPDDAKSMLMMFHEGLKAIRVELASMPLQATKSTTAREYSQWLMARMFELAKLTRVDLSQDTDDTVGARFHVVHEAMCELMSTHAASTVIELPVVDLLAMLGTSAQEVA